MWSNLKKTSDMEVGQVGFYRQKEVRVAWNSNFWKLKMCMLHETPYLLQLHKSRAMASYGAFKL